MSAQRRIDGKGRLTIPNDIREQLGLDPGASVTVELSEGEVVVRPNLDRERTVERLRGCINEETRREGQDTVDPEDLKRDWTSDLP